VSAAQEEPDVYGARTIKRERRTKARIEQLDWQIMQVLASDHPQSVRHMFYRMTDPRLEESVPKTDHGKENGYKAVQYRMKVLRRKGRLPYSWQAADYINDECRDRPVVIFYIGDYDPSEVLIDVAIERELRQHLRPEIDLRFIRMGITKEQIEEYDLPTKPRKATEKRSPHFWKQSKQKLCQQELCASCFETTSKYCCRKLLWLSLKQRNNPREATSKALPSLSVGEVWHERRR
jgi:hypothetical protein